MKRWLCICLTAVMLISALPAAAAILGVVRMPTKDGSVWLRTGPGTSYRQLGYALHGDLLQIVAGRTYWDRVTMQTGPSSGRTGWMYNKYITRLRNPDDMSGWGALARIKTKYAASTVCLRKGPSTSYGVKEYLNRNAMLIVLNRYNAYWYEVQVVNSLRSGYVYTDYITNGVIGRTIGNANMRKKASTSGAIIRVIPTGSQITVMSIGKNWSKITYGGNTGYISNTLFRLG